MKRYKLMTPLLLMALWLATSCHKISGEGPVVTESRNPGVFTGIDAGLSGTVLWVPDSIYRVTITSQQNILDLIETRVTGGKLLLRFKQNTPLGSFKTLRVEVHAPAMTSLGVSGSSDLSVPETPETDSLDLFISGSGDIHADALNIQKRLRITLSGSGNLVMTGIRAAAVTCTITGSGNIRADSGSAMDFDLKLSGSGDPDFLGVLFQNAVIQTTGSGETKVHATRELRATISGSGNIYYQGSPRINVNRSGSGKLIAL